MPYLFSRSFIEPLNGSVKFDQYHFAAHAVDSVVTAQAPARGVVWLWGAAGLGDDSSSSSSISTRTHSSVSSRQLNQ